MGAAEDISKSFSDRFNAKMEGTGKYNASPLFNQVIEKNITNKMRADASVAATQQKNLAKVITSNTTKTTKSGSTKKKTEFVADQAAQNAELKKTHDDKPWWGKALEGISKPLDIISRPAYAVAEGLRQIPKNLIDGEPIWSVGDDVLSGIGSGLWGTQKTSFGDFMDDVYYLSAKNDPGRLNGHKLMAPERDSKGYLKDEVVQDMWHNMDKGNRAFRRVFGGAIEGDKGVGKFQAIGIGDIAADPTTYAGVGLFSNAAKTADGALLLGEAAKEYIADETIKVSRKAIEDLDAKLLAKKLGGTYKFQTTEGKLFDDEIRRVVDESFQEIAKGGKAGRAIRGPEMPKVIANQTAEQYKKKVLEKLDKEFAEAGRVATGEVDKFKGVDGLAGFGKKSRYHEAYVQAFEEAKAAKVSALEKALTPGEKLTNVEKKLLKDDLEYIHKEGLKAVQQVVDNETSSIYKDIIGHIGQIPTKAVAFKVFSSSGKNEAKFALRRTSDLLDKMGTIVKDAPGVNTLREGFSYGAHFPGYTSLIGQKVKSLGISGYHDFYNAAREEFKLITKEERKTLTKALEDGTPLVGTLEEARQNLMKHYQDIFAQEVETGARQAAKTQEVPNYFYLYLHGGSESERNRFLKLRSDEIEKYGKPVTATLEEAKKKGLKPEEDAVKALLLRKAKSNRKMMKSWFYDDLVNHYGVVSRKIDLKSAGVSEREMVEVNDKLLTQQTRKALQEGDKFYLPNHIHEVFDRYNAMTKMDQEIASKNFVKAVDYVTRKFKAMSTIYYPSYHVRNMIGDMYMGMLDGVQLKDYAELLTRSTVKIGEDKISTKAIHAAYSEAEKAAEEKLAAKALEEDSLVNKSLRNEYNKTASAGGFFNTDVGVERGLLSGPGKAIQGGFRRASEARENFGRLAHFYHAMKEEYESLPAKMSKNERWKRAVDAATARVNYYKFDYSALTPFESKVMKRAMPFYTYSRKAMPLLADQLLFNPKMLSRTNRLMEKLSDNGNLDAMQMPDWIREIGYVPFANDNSAEPTVLRNDILPTNIFQQFFGPGYNVQGGPAQGVARNFASMVNPLAQIPFEASTGQAIFSGNRVTPGEAVLSHIRPWNTKQQFQAALESKGAEKWISLVAGLPLTKVSSGMKASAFKSHEDFMQAKLRELNGPLEQKGYSLGYVKRDNPNDPTARGSLEYRVYKLTTDGQKKAWLTGFSTLEQAAKALAENK